MKTSAILPVAEGARLKLAVRGAVQGVGFRPFVHRLATELDLRGWVNNSPQGVAIEVEGERDSLEKFLLGLEAQKPPHSFIQSLETSWLDAVGYEDFEIRESEIGGEKTALVLPDIGTCPDCLREIFDPANPRFRYPFANCTHCGPRFSIVESLPYDRANTSMKSFTMCPRCQAEYDDPTNRRFHAQPNACPVCGPHLELWDAAGDVLFVSDEALLAAAHAIRCGRIVAVKGLGGFHLLVAPHESAVRRLRELKRRDEKPLALMFPSLENAQEICEISPLEERLLLSSEAPIVLLKKKLPNGSSLPSRIHESVAPHNSCLGVMLPYTPLHHLLMAELGFPVVATSGNRSDEPICTDEHEALKRLSGVADLFLVHNRPIVRHVDDSIVRVMLGREMILRRARGYAPLPITLNARLSTSHAQPILAVGAHLKNSVALSVGPQVFISQHIGDLETEPALIAFRQVIEDFQKLYEAKPAFVAADAHPDYLSTKFAREFQQPRILSVQHHIAHVLSCMAENELEPPVLGIAWDGTGYGLDGTIWGGEFFLVTNDSIERVAHLRPFRLPGGNRAVKEPRRAALGLLHEIFGNTAFEQRELPPLEMFSPGERAALKAMLMRGVNSPWCCSAGRLFDAVAALIGLRQRIGFEGQAAMELEFALREIKTDENYPLPLQKQTGTKKTKPKMILDWQPMIEAILSDLKRGVAIGEISARFHNALAEAMVAVARQIREPRVVLSGGCFQNRYLTERTVTRLREKGFQPYWHQRVPTNDGGIALGQIAAAMRAQK